MKRLAALICMGVLVGTVGNGLAQGVQDSTAASSPDFSRLWNQVRETDGASSQPSRPVTINHSYRDSLATLEIAFYKAKINQGIADLEHRDRVFRQHRITSAVVFVLVIMIILSGLLLSFLQFRKDLNRNGDGKATNIRLGKEGIEISSSVLGLLILLMSLGFFYLYLTEVYPIREIQ
ncbi:MAG: hypothetical protein GY838_05615 [bacterium]|nr:hypothetical protein [bacterium]